MSAQPATNAILVYGPQGARQLGSAAVLSYSPPSTARRLAVSFAAPWAQSEPVAEQLRAPFMRPDGLDSAARAAWAQGAPRQRQARAQWPRVNVLDRERSAPWQQFARRLQASTTQPWGVASARDMAANAPWGQYARRAALQALAQWQATRVADQQASSPWGQYAARPALVASTGWAMARRADAHRWIPWTRFGRLLDPGWGIVTPPGGPIPGEDGTVVVPIRTVYIMTNEATLTRVDDGTALPVLSLSISTDADSWAWRVDASLPASAMDAIMPGMDGLPVLLQAAINGHPVRWLAESVTRERTFGKARIRVSGRSPSALLSDPFAVAYSYASASAISAQQAAINAVTEAGLPLGWDIGWHITDWLLPAGLWQHQGTPMSAVLRIAEAAGAYVQTDAVLQTLHVRHRYPTAPWGWGALTPAVSLPAMAALREGVEWVDKPAYNEVYVSGQSVGVLGHVVKTGTTGGLAAATVVDDLITHADAARQRGLAILGDTGRQQRLSLSLPINDDLGLLEVGQLIDVTEGTGPSTMTRRGLVRGVSASYSPPVARQNVEVEVHG